MAQLTEERLQAIDTEAGTEEDDQMLSELTAEDSSMRRRATKLAVYLVVGSCIAAVVTYIVAPSAIVVDRRSIRSQSRTKLTHSEQVSVHSYQLSASNTTEIDPTRDSEWGQLIALDDATIPEYTVGEVFQRSDVTSTKFIPTPYPTPTAEFQRSDVTSTKFTPTPAPTPTPETTSTTQGWTTEPWTWTSTQTTSTVTASMPWVEPKASPNLYCWEYVLSDSEVDLAKAQLLLHASIFQCNKFDVFSLTKTMLGGGPGGDDIYTTKVPGPGATVKWLSRDGQPAVKVIVNTPLFVRIWDQVNKLERFYEADWIIKVDADAVFLPERLRPHLAWKNINRDALVWFKNCQAPTFTTLQGPLEVFSHGAIDSFFQNQWKCPKDETSNGAEDWFMAHCLEAQGIMGTTDTELLNDNYCNHEVPVCDCSWGDRSAYHPCKDVISYVKCRNVALGR